MKIAVIVALLASGFASAAKPLARGWNDDISWVSWTDAKEVASAQDKPIMLLIHKTWCGACKSLKPVFAASTEIFDLSKNFVMVNAQDDEEPQEAIYKPDGGYIPRIVFMNSKGEVLPEVYNTDGNPKYKYYYPTVDAIVNSMKRATAVSAPQTEL